MIRPDSELHQIPPSEWTPEEVFNHLRKTFDVAAQKYPDLMERYAISLADCFPSEQASIMRLGLRETFKERHSTAYERSSNPPRKSSITNHGA